MGSERREDVVEPSEPILRRRNILSLAGLTPFKRSALLRTYPGDFITITEPSDVPIDIPRTRALTARQRYCKTHRDCEECEFYWGEGDRLLRVDEEDLS